MSKTLFDMAQRGLNPSLEPQITETVARQAIAYEFPTIKTPGRFLTREDFERQAELDDLTDLMWLLAEFQEPEGSPALIRQRLRRSQAERLDEFLGKFLKGVEEPFNPPTSHDCDILLAQAKNLVQRFVIEHEPIEITAKATKKIAWFPAKATWNSPVEQPPGSWIDQVTVAETITDAFMWRVADLLERHGQRIGICAEATCQRLFVKVKKLRQEYCSPSCSQKTRDAKMRQHPDWLERRRKISRRQTQRRKTERAQRGQSGSELPSLNAK